MPAYNEMSYDRLLLDGLRLASYKPGDGPLTNEGLVRAVTMNENLKSLGYTLSPQDIIKIAQSPSVDGFYEHVKAQMSDVKAKPMYPDFPKQVMEMSEAQYRMHQIVHYFSTYGLEAITGLGVDKGWLPAEAGLISDTEKTKEDKTLLNAKTLGLVPEDKKYAQPFEKILSKRERMTDEEREIVKRCVESGELSFDKKISVPFKENLKDVFMTIAQAGAAGDIPRQEASGMLYNICQHPGDVTENLHNYLAKNRYSLRTAEKKMFVSLYDRFSDKSFKANTIVPRSREKFTKEIFRHIGFTKYTKSSSKAQAVRDIGKERTWEAKARDMITSHDPEAIKFAAQRPGMLIRMMSMALRNGYSEGEIAGELSKKSCEISAQTLVSQICSARNGKNKTPKVHAVGAEKTENALNKEILSTISVRSGVRNRNSKLYKLAERREEKLQDKLNKIRRKEDERIDARNSAYDAQDRIFTSVLKDRFEKVKTGLEGKTVCFDTQYDLEKMNIDPSKKSMDQGYLPSRTAMKIPEEAKRIRCFVYWNDERRVDIDLHADAVAADGSEYHIGWDGAYDESGITMSGDITHSDAAEYIDVDLETAGDVTVDLRLNSYTGQHFKNIETCYAGIMAVDEIGQDVKLYDPKNCFASRDITNDSVDVRIGQLVTKDRTLYFSGETLDRDTGWDKGVVVPAFSMKEYLEILIEAQGGKLTEDPKEADVILTLTKPADEKEVSLIDNNYFFEAKPEEEAEKTVEKVEEEIQQAEEDIHMEDSLLGGDEKEGIEEIIPVLETDHTAIFIADGAREVAGNIFSIDSSKAVAVIDPKTEEVFVADGENPKGACAEGKDIVRVVMEIEEKAEPKTYMRVLDLFRIRTELKECVDDTMAQLKEVPDRKDSGTR